jgi:phosphosulfolactate phosphohydrolase-like enzyme
MVDEAIVFSRALSQDEITTAMKEGFAEILPVSPVDKALTTTWGTLKWANRRRGK